MALRLAPARDSLLLRLAPWTRDAWVTLARTVYYPSRITDPTAHPSILAHEYVHVQQWHRYGVLLWLGYLLGVPLPLFFAFVRARVECEAYAHEVVHYGRATEACVDAMSSSTYGWLRPRSLLRVLLERAVERARVSRHGAHTEIDA